ncbi:MAG TPA: hypothetical protein VKX17_03370 [Planctomycetota bacterium]|nr:hypothetical protein [Planctomycetota bacterium]
MSLAWFEEVKRSDPFIFLNPLVNEYFYVALHMFEAVACAFPAMFTSKTDYFSHVERAEELGRISVSALNPLLPMAAPYDTLSGLSRRARYIQISAHFPVSPIKPKDLDTAKASFQIVRDTIEKIFSEHGDKKIPWQQGQSGELIET